MGNRLHEGVCVNCGGPVIEANDWHCCSQCVKIIRDAVLKAVKNPGHAKTIAMPPLKKR